MATPRFFAWLAVWLAATSLGSFIGWWLAGTFLRIGPFA